MLAGGNIRNMVKPSESEDDAWLWDRPHDRPPGLLLHHLLRMLSNVEFSELLEEVEVPGFLSHSPSIATRLEAIV